MARQRGSTTLRGYGHPHQQKLARAIRAWQPGQPCARCGQPMNERWRESNGKRVTAIQLGHPDGISPGGLEHAYCNLRAGAISSILSQGKRPRTRTCACGQRFVPMVRGQRACSPLCGGSVAAQQSGRPWYGIGYHVRTHTVTMATVRTFRNSHICSGGGPLSAHPPVHVRKPPLTCTDGFFGVRG